MEDTDTEVLLAILSSLLEPPIPEQHVLLDALICADGNVEAAVKSLQSRHRLGAPQTVKKRAATGVLDDWVISSVGSSQGHKKSKLIAMSNPPKETNQVASTAGPSIITKSSKQLVPLTDVLRPPPLTSPTLPRLTPLTLSNPTMVEKHTPCTLHLGVLPSELACRLFHCMVDASKGMRFCSPPLAFVQHTFLVEWKSNKWWLFDRLVESHHKTSFYVRQVDGVNDDRSWHEEAQYWCLQHSTLLYQRLLVDGDVSGITGV